MMSTKTSRSDQSPDVIQAAGGLLWRQTPDGDRIAVIFRRRHQDWTLPKGKLDRGELWHEAALREVAEETGCDARLDRFAGSYSHVVNHQPKVVLFWHMELLGESGFKPSEEVERLEWLPPEEAIRILDYPDEAELLRAALRDLPPARARR